MTRRDFGATLAASLPLAYAADRKFKGVRLGVGTYSFRGMPLDEVVRVLQAAGAGGVELESMHVEPNIAAGPTKREELRKWRISVPLTEIQSIRKKFQRAGVEVYAYTLAVDDTFTDEEMHHSMLLTKALGARVLNTATLLPVARRLAPIAKEHGILVGLHPNGNANNPDAIGSGDSYRKALALGPNLRVNPDLYLFRNWGPDPLAFVREMHDRITSIHFHDRKGNEWVPFGEGDTPTRELLQLARKEKYGFAFSIERIYNVPQIDHVAEIRRSLDYCRKALTA